MRIDPLAEAAEKGALYINTPLRQLPAAMVAELKLLDLAGVKEKLLPFPPSRTLIFSLLLAAFLLLTVELVILSHLLDIERESGKAVLLALLFVLFLIGTVLFTMAVRLGNKRLRRRRQYLYFGENFLLERFPGRITLLPVKKIVYSFERRRFDPSRAGTDLYFDTVVYRDGHREVAYDLQDHYYQHPDRQRESRDNIPQLIKQRYAVKAPPPQSRFLQESF